MFNSSQKITTIELNKILHHEKVNVSKTYFNKYKELFVLCNSEEDLDAIFSETCISKLYTVGCKPVLPPDLKAKRSVILRRCDYQIFNKKEQDIKFEIEKQNACIRVQDIFKYDNSKNINVTFENQHMVSQVLTKGLTLFNLSHPAHNICREIFVDILTALSATNLKITIHHHALSLRSIKYADYVPLKNIHTVNAFLAFGSVSTVKKRETIIAPFL